MEQNNIEFSPYKNENVISLIKQPDGNYKGYMNKFGKVIEVRGVSPDEVLQLLLVNDGR